MKSAQNRDNMTAKKTLMINAAVGKQLGEVERSVTITADGSCRKLPSLVHKELESGMFPKLQSIYESSPALQGFQITSFIGRTKGSACRVTNSREPIETGVSKNACQIDVEYFCGFEDSR
jgi:hypothetical protein